MPQIGDLRTGVCRDLGVGDEGPAVFGGCFPMGMSNNDHSEMRSEHSIFSTRQAGRIPFAIRGNTDVESSRGR